MDKALSDLIKISNETGKDPSLVQGGGGNTSVKTADGKFMYIKASGTALKDMNRRQGWRRLRLDSVLKIIKDKSLAKLDTQSREIEVVNRLLLACDDNISDTARPSVETHMHAILGKSVIHLHPVVVGAYVNAKNGKKELEKLFKNEKLQPLWIPYAELGFALAKKISKLAGNYKKKFGKKPAIIFLQKHGLVISSDTAGGALRLVRRVIRVCKSKLPAMKAGKIKHPVNKDITKAKSVISKALFDVTGKHIPVSYFATNKPMLTFMARKDASKLLAREALTPAELVYANGPAMWVEICDVETIARRLTNLVRKGKRPSAAFIVKGMGLFVAGDKKNAPVIAEVTTSSVMIRIWAQRFGGIAALTEREQKLVNEWESGLASQ